MTDYVPNPQEQDNSRKSRLATELGGFNQIVAINQTAVNAALAYAWKSQTIDWTVSITDPETGEEFVDKKLSGKLLAPTVSFDSDTKGTFYANFGKCELTYWQSYGSRSVEKKLPFPAASLAFDVKFSLEEINALPDDVKSKIQNLGDYTAHQLLIDFSETNLLAPNKAKSDLHDAAKDQPTRDDISEKITSFMSKWIDKQKKDKKNILGYAIAMTDTEKYPLPTLSATSVTRQAYAYYKNGQQTPVDKVPSEASILFLNMFKGVPFPQDTHGNVKMLDYTGNFVTPFEKSTAAGEPTMAGSISIQGPKFWKALEATIQELSSQFWYYEKHFNCKYRAVDGSLILDYDIGMGNDNPNPAPPLTPNAPTSMKLQYRYEDSSEDLYGVHGSLGRAEGTLVTEGAQELWWTPGSSRIKVRGFTAFLVSYRKRVAASWRGWNRYGIETDWQFYLAMGVDTDGRLYLKCEDFEYLGDKYTTEASFGYVKKSRADFKGFVDSRRVDMSLEKVNEELGRLGQFVFPAAGQYFMFDPKFSNKGDVLVGLTLKAPEGLEGPDEAEVTGAPAA
ncbi:hypothetical protein K505DRAFT_367969 [Melanomma pulvis-pyrius CBS 109.77]|uniref:Uncharacterized protein n=1 Tax=Melanomma pulvis-pyrius CBS 109.77 TaxID=1314802 RepID=A0A6A6WS83_9PLEO|nr:hypothetical protein K505DRAFT_367969 [Melanomma pulvis-pyrius CBS 109.77]